MKRMTALAALLILAAAFATASGAKDSSAEAPSSSEQIFKEKKVMKTILLNKEEFLRKVVNYEADPQNWNYLGDKPALIDFYAPWCGPCKSLAPVLEELAAEYEGEIYIYKVNTEDEQDLASAFGIRSIPTLLFVPMGENPQVAQGVLPKGELKRIIDEVLLKK